MEKYIFVTYEGVCYAPNEEFVYNQQVLGIAEGNNERLALLKLIEDNEWITEMQFDIDEITAHKLN